MFHWQWCVGGQFILICRLEYLLFSFSSMFWSGSNLMAPLLDKTCMCRKPFKINDCNFDIDCLVQDSSNSIAKALELLQSCTKHDRLPLQYDHTWHRNTSNMCITRSWNKCVVMIYRNGNMHIKISLVDYICFPSVYRNWRKPQHYIN